jgi:hypothetical protein
MRPQMDQRGSLAIDSKPKFPLELLTGNKEITVAVQAMVVG